MRVFEELVVYLRVVGLEFLKVLVIFYSVIGWLLRMGFKLLEDVFVFGDCGKVERID